MSKILTSQFGEDMYIYNNFINIHSPDGTFIELGAMDGYSYSNTFFFENTLGFKGVLIEPTTQYNTLVQNRPNCKCINVAINYDNKDTLFIGNGACGGLESTMDIKHRNRFHSNITSGYYVKCSPLSDIINDCNLKYIDLLSIDVEGAELIVLETIDFSIPIYVIVIELDKNNEEKDQQCRDVLLKNGFKFDNRTNINEFWINENYFRKDKLFDKNIEKLNFSNMRQFGNIQFLDMNHEYIHELRDALLITR